MLDQDEHLEGVASPEGEVGRALLALLGAPAAVLPVGRDEHVAVVRVVEARGQVERHVGRVAAAPALHVDDEAAAVRGHVARDLQQRARPHALQRHAEGHGEALVVAVVGQVALQFNQIMLMHPSVLVT